MKTIRTRLLRLERSVEIKRCAAAEKLLPVVFETMSLTAEDNKLLEAISDGGPSTSDEQAALDRFAAEYERAFKLVNHSEPNSFR